jgi:CheY-like chemotaxis protein
MKLLIVEQDERLGEVYTTFLRDLAHEATLVTTATAAYRELETQAPDAVLLDVDLPERAGLVFLESHQVRRSAVPLIAVSATAGDTLALQCLRLGALDFLAKPVPFERLRSLLSFLEIYTLQAEGPRRRSPRLIAPIPLLFRYEVEWTAIDLSPFGVKVPRQASLQPGATVALSFALLDGRPPLNVKAVLVRTDSEGHLFSFVDLSEAEFRRLVDFCEGATSDPVAMFRLGLAYEFGRKVAQDRAEAVRWYRGAAALGHAPAAQRLRALSEEWKEGPVSDRVTLLADGDDVAPTQRPPTASGDPA